MSRIEDIQQRWQTEALYGANGEDYASDYRMMLNRIYELERENARLRSVIENTVGLWDREDEDPWGWPPEVINDLRAAIRPPPPPE